MSMHSAPGHIQIAGKNHVLSGGEQPTDAHTEQPLEAQLVLPPTLTLLLRLARFVWRIRRLSRRTVHIDHVDCNVFATESQMVATLQTSLAFHCRQIDVA
jgi:hypothetical protein